MAIKRCTASFAAIVNGAPRVVQTGALIDSRDPILKGREAHFEDVDTYVARRHSAVEAATAVPGEQRTITPPTTPASQTGDVQEQGGGPQPYDPDQHSNREVIEYLATASEAETLRVLEAEAAGQNRAGIVKGANKLLEDARTRDQEGTAS
jgi:hypothetical protein